MRRRLMWIFATLATVAALAPVPVAAAATVATQAVSTAATDGFSCRASGVRVKSPIFNSEPIVSNKKGNPCVDDSDVLATVTVPMLLSSGIVETNTDESPGGEQGATSDATVNNTKITLGGAVITAKVLASEAAVSCGPNGPELSGSSQLVGLNLNGTPIDIGDQSGAFPANPLVVVAVNEQIVQNGKLTQRALRVSSELLMTDIVIAESIADYEGSPCQAPPKPQCSDEADNDGDTKVDAQDPGCHTDGNPNNPASYDPDDNDETDGPPKQCADGLDNDDDKLTDSQDPGCHTDENPDNPGSYDPYDDDESDK